MPKSKKTWTNELDIAEPEKLWYQEELLIQHWVYDELLEINVYLRPKGGYTIYIGCRLEFAGFRAKDEKERDYKVERLKKEMVQGLYQEYDASSLIWEIVLKHHAFVYTDNSIAIDNSFRRMFHILDDEYYDDGEKEEPTVYYDWKEDWTERNWKLC